MLFTLTLILFLQVELSFYMYQCNSKTSVTVLKLLCDVCNLQIKGASVSEETVVLRRWEVSQKNLVWGFLCKFDNVKTFLTRSLSRVSEGKTSCDSKQRWSGGRIKKKERGFDRVINRSDPNLSLVYSPSYLTITLRYIPFALTKG